MSTSPEPEGSPRQTLPGARRRARERALELLYEAETKDMRPAELLAELPVAPEEYASELVLGVERRAEEVDRLLGRHATGWAVERMPMVDRCVLRMAAYELLGELEVPVAVVLDEAVELAKTYSTEDSGRYVNGVLSAVAAEVRTNEPEKADASLGTSLE
ncbi:MAG: transcription antitermination factor NusB [Acidimicrobiales bacterium]